jgi:hypothetical protein
MPHTILLLQASNDTSRTYADFENLNDALEGVCKIFEENLKKTHTTSPQITYDVSQLFDFVDELRDISCLVLDKKSFKYSPYDRDWIKEKIYILLRKQAGK